MTRPTVSVVMTCFNQRDFVGAAVDSILSQTYGDLELIVVDDGSSDGTDEVLRAVRDQRFSLIRQENGGPSVATNVGLRAAQGDYIAFMGGDDICNLARIETQLRQLQDADADLVFGLPEIIDECSQPSGDEAFPIFFGRKFDGSAQLFRQFFFGGNFLCGPTAFCRRSLFDRIGYYRRALIQLQDFDLWLRACKSGCRITLSLDRVLQYRVRRDGGNLSGKSNDARTRLEHLFIFRRFFEGAGINLLQAAFPTEITQTVRERGAETDIDIAFLYLGHSDPAIRALGVEQLIEMFDDDTHYDVLVHKRGFPVTTLFQLMADVGLQNWRSIASLRKNISLRRFVSLALRRSFSA